jgi:hypothetical protein
MFHPFRSQARPSPHSRGVAEVHRLADLRLVADGESGSEGACRLTACWTVSTEGRLCCGWTVPASDFHSISDVA